MPKIKCEIITPEGKILDDELNVFRLKGVEGYFNVMNDHTPMITGLDVGVMTYTKDEKSNEIALGEGFIDVQPEKAVVLVDTAEFPNEIDIKRAKEAKQRAENRLKSQNNDVDIFRAQAALKRALTRLDIAQRNKAND